LRYQTKTNFDQKFSKPFFFFKPSLVFLFLFSVLASLQNVIKMLHLHLPSFVGDNARNSDSGITFLGFLGLCDNY
jgi:hypothetical protein